MLAPIIASVHQGLASSESVAASRSMLAWQGYMGSWEVHAMLSIVPRLVAQCNPVGSSWLSLCPSGTPCLLPSAFLRFFLGSSLPEVKLEPFDEPHTQSGSGPANPPTTIHNSPKILLGTK